MMKFRTLNLLIVFFLAASGWLSAQTYRWGNVKIGGGGYTIGVKIHPENSDLIYVRTDVGGLYRWDKSSKQLQQLFNWVPDSKSNLYGIAGIALNPDNQNLVYVGAGKYRENQPHGVFKSTNMGRTWTDLNIPVSSPFDVNRGNADHRFGNPLEINPKKTSELWVGTVKDGLYVYDEDNSNKWKQIKSIPTGYSIRSIRFDQNANSPYVYVGIRSKGVYRSSDGGVTFSLVPGSESFTIQDMDLSKNGDKLFLATETQGVQRLDDAKEGSTWSSISPGGYTEFRGLATSPNDNDLIVTSPKNGNALNTIYVSKNSGDTWTLTQKGDVKQIFPWHSPSYPGAAISQLVFDPNPAHRNRVFFTDWYSFWETDNILEPKVNWTNEYDKGHEEVVCLALATPPQNPAGIVLYTGFADVTGFRHTNIDQLPDQSFQVKSRNAGGSFNDITGIDYSEGNSAYVAISGENKHADGTGAFAYSTNYGETFSPSLGYDPSWGFARIAVGTSKSNSGSPSVVAATKSAGIKYSTDGGKTWSDSKATPPSTELGISSGVFNHVYPIAADRGAANKFYLYNRSNNKVLVSTDGGATFSLLTSWGNKNADKDKKGVPSKEEDAMSAGKSSNGMLSIEAAPGVANQLWGALGKEGLYYWNGKSSSKISNVKEAVLMSIGKKAPHSNYPTIYIYGKLLNDAENWIYRSTDKGLNWTKVNDINHRIGDSPQLMKADQQIYGRIFIGTDGTGVWFGELTR